MRQGGQGMLTNVEVTLAHHVGDLDHHLRQMRSANAELRARIAAVRDRIEAAEVEKNRRADAEREVGAKVLRVEAEIAGARRDAGERVAAMDAAADEEIRQVMADADAQIVLLRGALDAVLTSAEPADVVPLVPRPAAVPTQRDAGERSAAM